MADFDNNSSSRSKWLWLLLIVLLGVVLLLWVFGAADDGDTAEDAAPLGVSDEAAMPAPAEEPVEVELPDSDFELPEPVTETQPDNEVQ